MFQYDIHRDWRAQHAAKFGLRSLPHLKPFTLPKCPHPCLIGLVF